MIALNASMLLLNIALYAMLYRRSRREARKQLIIRRLEDM